ncbi:carbon-nitrogen hydrolase [Rubellicoccus peritrichatus]|uniref:Carbon-nitrogen hydrolase n=2 Tax=Rubellicoccus peritrichatus TaxID=3080537 RepID=A0AAQ3LAV6_9BACT|nr:carbon-nitrogen hydrolase [Puniceicoccus sp. CR14]WOO41877.1 carbon-nitrogen hydrolase [Puniceicoccus sp. CR14]
MSTPRTANLGLIQMAMTDHLEENILRAENAVREAHAKGAQIVVLPELVTTRYFCRTQETRFFDLAETVPGPTTERMQKLAVELEVVLVVPLFERVKAGLYFNTAAVIDADGSFLGKYRKTHIPQDPGFEEKFYFTEGDLGYPVFETRYAKLGVLICWDQWFPEAARLMALGGAELIVYPTAIGWLPKEKAELGEAQYNAWKTVQHGHAVANGCYVAAINRVGIEGEIEFWGRSFVSDFYGQSLLTGSEDSEVLTTTLDFTALEEFRRIWPFFRDRRIDKFADLQKRTLL